MRGCFDVVCPRCRARIGWRGAITDRPACRQCGHRPDQDTLKAAAEQLEAASARMDEALKTREAKAWAARTPAQERWYSEGVDACVAEGCWAVGCLAARGRIPGQGQHRSPYTALNSKDGKWRAEEHGWWMQGWHDALGGVDRRREANA